VSTEPRQSPDPDLDDRPKPESRSPWGVAAVALVAGLLQIVASIVLGIARLDRFVAAANEGPAIYMVVVAQIAAAVASIWVVRERAAVALALAVLWPVGLWYGLRGQISTLGLAYHGEFILHHFAALLCLILVIGVPLGWAWDPRIGARPQRQAARETALGRVRRFVPLALALPGALALAGAHLAQVPIGPEWLASRALSTTGAILLLAAWPASVALFWAQLGPPQRRPLALILMLPIVVRVGFAGPHGLSGELVEGAGVTAIGAALVVTSMIALVLLRPRIERWVMVVVGVICLIGSMFFYYLYEQAFGNLEDGLSGLLQSLFGFQVPYPSYVDDVRSAALMMGLFFMVVTVYGALVSTTDRIRGIALGLMVVAGLGFSSPHLVLMLGAGALLVIEGMLPGAPHRELSPAFQANADPTHLDRNPYELGDVHTCIEGLAERLDLEAPTVAATGSDSVVVSLRGELDDGVVLDLRARIEPKATRVELSIGLAGRTEPIFELIPDLGKRGQRPTHLLARSHRVHGELRALEEFGDAPLDALASFPTAYLRAWEGGVQIDLGRELHGLRVDNLEALVRSIARAVRL